ncbi:MAG: hypothetical protein DRJ38_05410, partial [Thermoprotei archaeon]
MQTLTVDQYNALDEKSRRPCAKVLLTSGTISIPFEGQAFTPQIESEFTPAVINHISGRYCIVFTRNVDVSGVTKRHLHFKNSDVNKYTFNSAVDLVSVIPQNDYDYYNPCLVAIGTANIGIVVNREGTLFSMIVSASTGNIVTDLTNLNITGEHPTLFKMGTDYWLMYERSGELYYKTSTDFVTWSAESLVSTGLTNGKDYPYLTQDNSGKKWLLFEREDDVAIPPLKNIYYMTSTDNGSTWSSASALTNLTTGDGQAVKPKLVDTDNYIWFSYVLKRTIQNLKDSNYPSDQQKFPAVDNTGNRVGMIVGNKYLSIYDRLTGLYTTHDLTLHGLTSTNITSLAYDETNKIWVVGTYYNGLIVYDESTTAWYQYNTSTTPALQADMIKMGIITIENKIIYCVSWGLTTALKLEKINMNTNTVTVLGTITLEGSESDYWVETRVNSNYIVTLVRTNNNASKIDYPHVYVFQKSTDSLLYNTRMAEGSQYRISSDNTYATDSQFHTALFGWDKNNGIVYSLAYDANETSDNGIIAYQIGNSAISFVKYYSQLPGNSAGLLPNPDEINGKISFIKSVVFNDSTKRLYIEAYTTLESAGGEDENYYSVLNTLTDEVLEIYSNEDATAYSVNYPSLDVGIKKSLYAKSYIFLDNATSLTSSDGKDLIFTSDKGLAVAGRYTWHILTTESVGAGVLYRKSDDEITWTSPARLTKNALDNDLCLVAEGTKLVAFWDREEASGTHLYWDEDLSAEINLTEYVESLTITMSDENGANTASIQIADAEGSFNPLNYNSLRRSYLKEGTMVQIQKGNNNGYTPAFYGYIASGEASYLRNGEVLYNITLYDKSKNWFKKKVTTSFYQDQTVSSIIVDVITNYGGLTPSEYDLPSITATIPKVQFIEEYIMDILYKLYQAYGYFPYFDESGILRAREINMDATTDFTYYENGTDTVAENKASAMNVVEFNHRWSDDELVNKVTVMGQTRDPVETVFPEEFMGFIQGSAGWFSKSNDFTFYFSEDKTLLAVNPRLEVKDSCGNQFFGGGESLSTVG